MIFFVWSRSSTLVVSETSARFLVPYSVKTSIKNKKMCNYSAAPHLRTISLEDIVVSRDSDYRLPVKLSGYKVKIHIHKRTVLQGFQAELPGNTVSTCQAVNFVFNRMGKT